MTTAPTTTVKYGAKDLTLVRGKWLSATLRDGSLHFEGTARLELGHRIPRPDRDIDDGIFGGWSLDGQTVRAFTDRYGMWPVFYYFDGSRLVLADSMHAIIDQCKPLALDAESIPVFLTLGFFLGESTPFAKVKVLPPKGELSWDGLALKITGSRDWSKPQQISKNDAIDGYIALFRQSISRRLELFGRPKAMLLSGGRDSRHILLEYHRQGAIPDVCGTARHKFSGRNETACAARLSKAAGVRHESIEMAGSPHLCQVTHSQATNLCADEHGWLTPAFAWLGASSSVAADGIAGDILSAGLFLTSTLHDLVKSERFFDASEILVSGSILSDDYRRLVLSALRIQPDVAISLECIQTELASCAQASCPSSAWYFWNRTRREIALAPLGLGQAVDTLLMPYLDADVFDFLTSLPDWMLLEHTLHNDVIARAYPAFASVPYTDKGQSPRVSLHERLLVRLDREIGEARMFGIWKRPIPRLRRFHRGLMPWLAEVLKASEGMETNAAYRANKLASVTDPRGAV